MCSNIHGPDRPWERSPCSLPRVSGVVPPTRTQTNHKRHRPFSPHQNLNPGQCLPQGSFIYTHFPWRMEGIEGQVNYFLPQSPSTPRGMIDPKEPRMIHHNFKVESTIINIIIIEMARFLWKWKFGRL